MNLVVKEVSAGRNAITAALMENAIKNNLKTKLFYHIYGKRMRRTLVRRGVVGA